MGMGRGLGMREGGWTGEKKKGEKIATE